MSEDRLIEQCDDWQQALSLREPRSGYTSFRYVGDHARPGYWRVKYPDAKASHKPVHIIARLPEDENGDPVGDEKFECFVAGAKVPLPRVWPYCGKSPISRAEYDEMMAPNITADLSRIPMEQPAPPRPEPTIMSYWSEGRAHIASAMIKAQEAIPTIQKGHTAKVESKKGAEASYEYDYADIADLMDGGVRKAVAEAGLAVVHQPVIVPGKLSVYTTLVHGGSGEWCMGEITLAVSDARPQTIGSILTYFKRYNLLGLLNIAIADDDDDGGKGEDNAEKTVTTGQRAEVTPEEAALRFARKLAKQMDAATAFVQIRKLMDEPENHARIKKIAEQYPEAHKVIMAAHDRNAGLQTTEAAQ